MKVAESSRISAIEVPVGCEKQLIGRISIRTISSFRESNLNRVRSGNRCECDSTLVRSGVNDTECERLNQ